MASTSDSRVGRALTGPRGAAADSDEAAPRPAAPPPSRRRSWFRNLATLVASLAITVALFALPALARLVGQAPDASASALSSPANNVIRSTASSPSAVRRYVVRAGDTLRSIAIEMYGDVERWEAIYRANQAVIGDPDILEVGSTLIIP
jgi:nucleoid-associated protein YgaU